MSGVQVALIAPCSSVEVLRSVWAYAPTAVVRRAAGRSEALAGSLPFDAQSVYLEGRFGSNTSIDYLVAARGDHGVWGFNAPRSSSWKGKPGAKLLSELSNSTELSDVRCVWFEYDDSSDSSIDQAVPSISVALEPDYLRRHRYHQPTADSRSPMIAKAALRALVAGRSQELEFQLESCFRALPATAAILYLSVMHGRKLATVKLYIALPRSCVESYLAHVGWRGDQGRLRHLLETYYAPFSTMVYVDLTLSQGGMADRIGLATSQFHRLEVDLDSPTLDWLRLPSEYDAMKRELCAWPGEHCIAHGERRSVVRRWLDTKAVIDGDQIEYKFYLGFMSQPGRSLLLQH